LLQYNGNGLLLHKQQQEAKLSRDNVLSENKYDDDDDMIADPTTPQQTITV